MAAPAQCVHGDRSRSGAGGGRCRRRGACQGQPPRRAARRAAGTQGHVLRRGAGGDLRIEDPARFRRDHDLDRAQRLKDAGTVRLGTLQMAEFAYGPTGHNSHYGPVHNPWGLDHITGGSSSGSGAAVAARLTFAALGSDTGGSIRMPAHFCGVTGLKTTVGRISRAGAMPLSQSLDTVGPLARSVEDCALLLGLMAGADPDDPDRGRRAVAGLHGGGAPADARRQDRHTHGVLCRRSRFRSGAHPRRDRRGPQAGGRHYRCRRTAGSASAHRGVPAGAGRRSRRVSQAMDDRASARITVRRC